MTIISDQETRSLRTIAIGVLVVLLASFLTLTASTFYAQKLDAPRFVAESLRVESKQAQQLQLLLELQAQLGDLSQRFSDSWCANLPANKRAGCK